MKHLRLPLLILAAVALVIAGYAGLEALVTLSPSGKGLFQDLHDLELRQTESDHMDSQIQDLLVRDQLKVAMADDLAAGRLTLPEAAQRLRDTIPPGAKFWDWLPSDIAGDTDDERLCWHMVHWTRTVVAFRKGPEEAAQVAQRLENELRQLVQKGDGSEPRTVASAQSATPEDTGNRGDPPRRWFWPRAFVRPNPAAFMWPVRPSAFARGPVRNKWFPSPIRAPNPRRPWMPNQ